MNNTKIAEEIIQKANFPSDKEFFILLGLFIIINIIWVTIRSIFQTREKELKHQNE